MEALSRMNHHIEARPATLQLIDKNRALGRQVIGWSAKQNDRALLDQLMNTNKPSQVIYERSSILFKRPPSVEEIAHKSIGELWQMKVLDPK